MDELFEKWKLSSVLSSKHYQPPLKKSLANINQNQPATQEAPARGSWMTSKLLVAILFLRFLFWFFYGQPVQYPGGMPEEGPTVTNSN